MESQRTAEKNAFIEEKDREIQRLCEDLKDRMEEAEENKRKLEEKDDSISELTVEVDKLQSALTRTKDYITELRERAERKEDGETALSSQVQEVSGTCIAFNVDFKIVGGEQVQSSERRNWRSADSC